MALFMTVRNLTKYYGPDLIFQGLTFVIDQRDRIGLIGPNGAGKSTLMRILAGEIPPDEGTVTVAAGARVTYLPQEGQVKGTGTLREEMEAVFASVYALEERASQLLAKMGEVEGDELDAVMAEYDEVATRLEAENAYSVEHRIKEVTGGLGFGLDELDMPVQHLSGGQKTRAALARTLLEEPDLLLLDEPTNHLDIEAIDWLIRYLEGYRGAILMVSHDPYFLDTVTTRTLELEDGQLIQYPAPYTRALAIKAERRERQRQQYERQQRFIARVKEFIERARAGQRAAQAQSRQRLLDRLKLIEPPRERDRITLNLRGDSRGADQAIVTTPLECGYDGTVIVRTPKLELRRGEKVALLGPNGSGKSTLIKTLVGQIPPISGTVTIGEGIVPAYYGQAHEQLDPELTVLESVVRNFPISEEGARAQLARLLFRGDDVFKKVAVLSGGERSRLAMAMLLLLRGNLLLLDEPTNHLDLESREVLSKVLNEYTGTLLMVSHDRDLIELLAERLWIIEDGELTTFHGSYAAWREALERADREATPLSV
jgi:ATP-binding cassette subfamily F protein 3